MGDQPNSKNGNSQNGTILIEFEMPHSVIHSIQYVNVLPDQMIVVANRLKQLAEMQIAAQIAQSIAQTTASKIARPNMIMSPDPSKIH